MVGKSTGGPMVEVSGLSGAAIRQYAESVFNVPEYRSIRATIDSGVKVDRFVELLGGRIMIDDTPRARLSVATRGDFVIRIPASSHPLYQRQLIAHELGHYFLHYLYPRRQGQLEACFTGTPEPAEIEANRYAMSLLVPTEDYRQASRDARKALEARASWNLVGSPPTPSDINYLAAIYLQVPFHMVEGILQLFPDMGGVDEV